MKKAFTFLELLISLSIVITGIVGVFALIEQTIRFLPISEQRLKAGYLAQEGLEIVRNLRDTNVVNEAIWNLGLSNCGFGCEADYASQSLASWQDRYLKDNNIFYNYDFGSPTFYKRKISIDASDQNVLKTTVEVFWQEKTRPHSIKAVENFYNWY